MTETILLTGATGVVGTHFLYKLRERKYKPLVTAVYQRSVPKHLKGISEEGWVEFVRADLTTEDIHIFIRYDTIIHAATYAQPGKFMNNQSGTLKLNTAVTQYLIDKCLNHNGRFLFISSSEVYRGSLDAPFKEEHIGTTNPFHKRACYIEGKRCGESIVQAYRNVGVDAKSVRLSLAYGEGTRVGDERVMSQFIETGIKEGVVRTSGNGSAMRTYCYISDAVDMMTNVLYKGESGIYNIGGVSAITISDLAWAIAYELGVNAELGGDNDKTASQDTRMSIDRYVCEFGDVNFTPLSEGIERTVKYQKQLYK